jgi:hypothetical protein
MLKWAAIALFFCLFWGALIVPYVVVGPDWGVRAADAVNAWVYEREAARRAGRTGP